MVAGEPFVQVIVKIAVPGSGVVALATTGSYAPKASAPAAIVQLALTVADTLMLLVAVVCAETLTADKMTRPNVTTINFRMFVFKLSLLGSTFFVH
jgi:hypothetical protein